MHDDVHRGDLHGGDVVLDIPAGGEGAHQQHGDSATFYREWIIRMNTTATVLQQGLDLAVRIIDSICFTCPSGQPGGGGLEPSLNAFGGKGGFHWILLDFIGFIGPGTLFHLLLCPCEAAMEWSDLTPGPRRCLVPAEGTWKRVSENGKLMETSSCRGSRTLIFTLRNI